MVASGAREEREVKSLSSRWRETRLVANGAGGMAVMVASWLEPAWRVVREGNLDAIWHISGHERRVSSRASSVTPAKASPADSRISSSRMPLNRFPLAIHVSTRALPDGGKQTHLTFRLRNSLS